MNPNLIKAAIIVATLSIPTIAFLSVWIRNLRKKNSEKDLEINNLGSFRDAFLRTLEKLELFLTQDDARDKINKLISEMDYDNARGLLSLYEGAAWGALRGIFVSNYLLVFERDFRKLLTTQPFEYLVGFDTKHFNIEGYLATHVEFKKKSFDMLACTLDKVHLYSDLVEIVRLLEAWGPFEYLKDDMMPLIQAKGSAISQKELTTNRTAVLNCFQFAKPEDKPQELKKLFLEAIDILNRKIISDGKIEAFKKEHRFNLNRVLTEIRAASPKVEVTKIVLELGQVFEQVFGKEEAVAQ